MKEPSVRLRLKSVDKNGDAKLVLCKPACQPSSLKSQSIASPRAQGLTVIQAPEVRDFGADINILPRCGGRILRQIRNSSTMSKEILSHTARTVTDSGHVAYTLLSTVNKLVDQVTIQVWRKLAFWSPCVNARILRHKFTRQPRLNESA
jgi:hypothetical protein